MFITFEGIEGSGKTTHIQRLFSFLKSQGHDVVLTREPGGTAIGDQIRKILLDRASQGMTENCEQLLYWAARAQHIRELILPHLQKGHIVLCDRYVDSTTAYQGYGRGIDFSFLKTLEKMVTGSVVVDRTFLFDLSVAEGLQRARKRIERKTQIQKEDRFENEAIAFHEKVRQGFLELAKKEPKRFVVFDASLDKNTLQEKVQKEMLKLL